MECCKLVAYLFCYCFPGLISFRQIMKYDSSKMCVLVTFQLLHRLPWDKEVETLIKPVPSLREKGTVLRIHQLGMLKRLLDCFRAKDFKSLGYHKPELNFSHAAL